ncbi:MAG: FAD-linked oxidase C-terminal domain-containing protein [Phycisphaerales bacterium]
MKTDASTEFDLAFIEQVAERCGLRIDTDPHVRGLYATDASIYQVAPLAVVTPERLDQIPELLRLCAEHAVPVLPRGGGTSLAGQCVNRALVVDVSRFCHGLLSVDAGAMRCRVEAGMTIDDLNDRLRDRGVFFAPDPSTARQANIGGCIGNNAAGVHSVLYGRTSENVVAIDACLADGRRVGFGEDAVGGDATVKELTARVVDVVRRHAELIRERFPKTMRRSSGYQLDVILDQLEANGWNEEKVSLVPLLCGSEGTLALTLGATLKLHSIPQRKGLAVLSFDDLDSAIAAVEPILTLQPAAVELLDDLIMDLARGNKECARYVDVLPDAGAAAVLFVEFFGDDDEWIAASFEALRALLPGCPVRCYTDSTEMAKAWKLRKSGEPLLHAIEGSRKPLGFVEDNAVPVVRLGEFVKRFRSIVEDEDTIASYYAHASVGVLHVRPLLDLRDPDDERAMHRIAARVADLALELGGVPSGEHGDGRARGPFIEQCFGPELLGAFREIKAIFDPQNLLNPGNIVEPGQLESISEHTRIRPEQRPVRVDALPTYYQYKPEHGFAHAIELCNGAGVCRRKEGGVMCPSYQVTLDERHSTRGRGNALRLAITGQIDLSSEPTGEAALNHRQTEETLDLCLSCKGCKSECPSSVDIAKLKSEYLAQGYRQSGRIPARVRVMSNIHRLNTLGARMPAVSNAMQRFAPVRALINRAMGVHPERSLPKFAKPVRPRPIPGNDRPKVVLLSDTFTTHNEPRIAHAAVAVLEELGYAVGIETISDLGRAAISVGNLGHAIEDARRTLDRLEDLINDEGVRGLLIPEPSCLSAITDDWADLKLDRDPDLIQKLIAKAALPETFIDAFWDRHPIRPEVRSMPESIMLHGHCHQKALWGDSTSSAIFERLCPGRVRVLPTGCCGMAGSFGYAAHRYELSLKIGEQVLFPAVRSAQEGEIIVAPGTSCRHQIFDGTGRKALHPIEALAVILGCGDA